MVSLEAVISGLSVILSSGLPVVVNRENNIISSVSLNVAKWNKTIDKSLNKKNDLNIQSRDIIAPRQYDITKEHTKLWLEYIKLINEE